MARKFAPARTAQQEETDAQWRAISERTFDDFELEEYDKKLADFNFLRSRRDIEAYYVHVGAARFGYRPYNRQLIFLFDAKNPQSLCVERVNNKIEQWSKWRSKKFPQSKLNDYARMAREAFHGKPFDPDLGELASEFPEEPIVIEPVVVGHLQLTRSGLNRYKKNHGQEYEVPAHYTVIEDEPAA